MVDDTRPWCSTKVDQFNKAIPGLILVDVSTILNIILGVGEWGYCNSDCPSDDGFPASGSGKYNFQSPSNSRASIVRPFVRS